MALIKALVDTNIVLDVVLNRAVFYADAKAVTAALENNLTHIITRNADDYEIAGIAVSPAMFLTFVNEAQTP